MSQDHDFRRLSERLATYRQDMIDLQRELVRRNAVGPENDGPGEGAKAAFLKDLLESWGLKVDNYPAPDPLVAAGERPNLVAWLPGRRPDKVWVLSHLDVVPEGDVSLWQSDPFDLRVEGDRLYGRGTEDDHHGIVSSLMAAKAFLDLGLTPERTVALALVADEETGSHLGLEFLLREQRQLFSEQDLIIVPDAGNEDGTMIEVAEKSILWLRLELLGKQAHASRPQVGRNTLRACAHVIVALEELKREFSLQNPLFRPPESTFEPTRKEANVGNINTIPGRDVFYLDCRVLPGIDLKEVMARVKAIGRRGGGKIRGDPGDGAGAGVAQRPAHRPGGPGGAGLATGHPGGLRPGGYPAGHRRRHRGRFFPPAGPAGGGLDDGERHGAFAQ